MVDETYMVDNYKVTIEHDFEEDNVKAFTDVITPDGNRHFLDVTPYSPSKDLITRMIEFHQKFGYFVTRQEAGSGAPVELGDLETLFKIAEEHQFDNAEGKIYD
jgi:hypothetical protein